MAAAVDRSIWSYCDSSLLMTAVHASANPVNTGGRYGGGVQVPSSAIRQPVARRLSTSISSPRRVDDSCAPPDCSAACNACSRARSASCWSRLASAFAIAADAAWPCQFARSSARA